MQSPSEILGPEGPFARLIPGFAPRPQQQEMAEAVACALEERSVLIAEAGTGTGKTFAYLVPALLSGQKVIVSTGTKNLQDQLFHKDLPIVRDALGVPVDVAMLKGRANYLCVHRLELAVADGRFTSRSLVRDLQSIKTWAAHTQTGDLAELPELSEDSPLRPVVSSTSDNCLGGNCERLDDCFLVKARRRAQEADVLVVNHHLLFADMALRDEGFGELLPGANAFILDEAHQLPETASSFFGIAVTGNQLIELARDSAAENIKMAGADADFRNHTAALEKAVRDLRLAFGEEQVRASWKAVAEKPGFRTAVETVAAALRTLQQALEPLAARSKGLEDCSRRCADFSDRFALVTGVPPDDYIHWFETHTRSFTINLTPLDVANLFYSQVESKPCAWILTSATLTVGGSFDHFAQRLGLQDAGHASWDSPFDFPKQALLYVPPDMPDPSARSYTQAVVAAALPVIEAAEGRTFMLFTSHRALREAAELLQEALPYPLLVQGDMPRSLLLERFRELGNAVLLGTGSFWEGVDVRGEALSCVIIDKLPFASPGDPVLEARIEALREKGGNPFMDYQLPQAVITLKQGVGRLIRDIEDHGTLVICDPRLGTRAYGRIFLQSLPPMSRTRKLEVVQRFFAMVARY